MELVFDTDAGAFLERAGAFLAAEPVLTTLLGQVSTRLRDQPDRGAQTPAGRPPSWWATAYDEAGAVVGAAMRTAPMPPHPVALSPMPAAVAAALAEAVTDRGEELLGVNAPLDTAWACARELARRQDREVRVETRLRLHEATSARRPDLPVGRLRAARPDETAVVLDWFDRFRRDADEIGGRAPAGPLGETEDQMLARIAAETVWFWEVAGDPGHLTCFNPPAFGVARVGPVYTPAPHRGRGYAGAAVALVTERLLAAGARPCLFTDLANPTSNRIYAAVGFAPVADLAELRLV